MKRKKTAKKLEIELREEEKSDIKFCTECGEALEDFSVSDMAKDPKAVIENFHNCKKTGKFKGDVCSKLYMISPTPEEDELL
ncbi:MAG: hypothetical protein WHV63_11030 [Ignavibacteria bacterium]|jgi:uncharacterized protein with PIN domain